MSSQLIDELRSVEVVDWDDVDEAAAQPGVGFGYAYDQDDIDAALEEQQRQRAGAAKKKDGGAYDSDEEEQSSTRRGTVDSDAPAVFTAPQEVTNEEYDAVQQLLKQAKEAKNEAKQLAIERKKMEKQIKALTQLNEQLKAKNTGLQNEADENKAEQLKKLVEANARLAATKGKDPNSAKKQEELQRALEGAEGYLLDELEEEKKSAGHKHMAREPWYRRAAAWYKTTVQRLQDKMGHKEVRYVEARFGQGIAVYFLFLRYLWMLNVLSFIVGGTIAVYQVLLAFSDPNGLVLLPAGSGQVPRFVLFSLFPASGALLYASIMAGLGFFLVGMAVKKYSEEKAEEKAEQVYADAEANQFSKLAFGGWDFKMFDKSSIEDAMIQASENMNMALKEEEVLAKIANRSKNEKNKLLAMKAFGIFVNAVLILASWFTIGSLTYLSAPGTDSFFSDPTTLFGKIHAALPMTNLALIVINGSECC
jgi:chemotaxis protein histidine kinase CheA